MLHLEKEKISQVGKWQQVGRDLLGRSSRSVKAWQYESMKFAFAISRAKVSVCMCASHAHVCVCECETVKKCKWVKSSRK